MATVQLEISAADMDLIIKIVVRAMGLTNIERLELAMDLTACHANGHDFPVREIHAFRIHGNVEIQRTDSGIIGSAKHRHRGPCPAWYFIPSGPATGGSSHAITFPSSLRCSFRTRPSSTVLQM